VIFGLHVCLFFSVRFVYVYVLKFVLSAVVSMCIVQICVVFVLCILVFSAPCLFGELLSF